MASEFQNLLKNRTAGGGSISAKDVILKYLAHWPLFLLGLLLSLGAAYIYLRYTVPTYAANTIINVKGETTTTRNNSGGGDDLIVSAMNGGRAAINLDNELGRLRSARLMEKVVRNSDLNISYYKQGNVIQTDIYHAAPFRLIERDILDSSKSITASVTGLTDWGFTLTYGSSDEQKAKAIPWNKPFYLLGNTYVMTPMASGWNKEDKYVVTWNPVYFTVYELMPKVSVNVLGKTTNIAVNVTIENAERGEEVLDKMVAQFIQMNLDDQNRAAQDKIYFIEERLGKVSGELKGVEKNLSNYQGSNLLVGGTAAGTEGTPISTASNAIAEINTQRNLLNLVKTSLQNQSNSVLPSGIADPVLSGLIGRYNELVLTRQREAPLVTPNSLVLQDLDNQLQTLRSSLISNIITVNQGLQIQSASQARQSARFRSSMSVVPEKERVVGEIAREKSVKENLYMYLLQKREETAISKTSTSPYEQIDLATSWGPVSPKKAVIYQIAVLAGLLIPAAIVFLKNLMNEKISSRIELEKATDIPIVGEINHIKKIKEQPLASINGGVVGEQFRIIRANLRFLQKDVTPVVMLVTSSASGEGKSFVSLNLAAVQAKAGKKVALLEFDLRKPVEEEALSIFQGPGVTEYLNGELQIKEIVRHLPEMLGLHIFPPGKIVSGSGDLILDAKVPALFEYLKQHYDVVIVNTAPVGLVSDALILLQYCNIIGYVVRQGYTTKKDVGIVNALVQDNKFSNTCIIYNGARTGMKYGYYGNGYSKNNSYFDRNGADKVLKAAKQKRKKALFS